MITSLQSHYLRLSAHDCLPPDRFGRLLGQLKSIAGIRSAINAELVAATAPAPELENLLRCLDSVDESPGSDSVKVERWLQGSTRRRLVCFEEQDYPPLLKEISYPPPVLFVEGQRDALDKVQLAIVGSRKASKQGQHLASRFASELAAAGFCITSGLAVGIDSRAHQGALTAGGYTLAVLGTGIDELYPARNRRLAEQVRESGVLVSEFPLGTPPLPVNFPRRNRLIAGLSVGVLVVEAAPRSGSLITARLATEANREVFAVPGSILSGTSRGCHDLIRAGAKLVDSVDSILEELVELIPCPRPDVPVRDAGSARPGSRPESSTQPGGLSSSGLDGSPSEQLAAEEIKLLRCLDFDPCPVDLLAERAELAVDQVSRLISRLELKGFLEQSGGRIQRLPAGLQPDSD